MTNAEVLLLRLVIALRRRSLAHDEAVALAASGLPPGTLRDEVGGALRELRAGVSVALAATPTVAGVLARGNVTVEELEATALGLEAFQRARMAVGVVRVHLALAMAGPLLLATAAVWFTPLIDLAPGDWRAVDDGLGAARTALRWLGVPLAMAAIVVADRISARFAPGLRRARAAVELYTAAAGSGAIPAGLSAPDSRFFRARREHVGQAMAARELADELVREAQASFAAFEALAPVLTAVFVFPLVAAIVELLLWQQSAMSVFEIAG